MLCDPQERDGKGLRRVRAEQRRLRHACDLHQHPGRRGLRPVRSPPPLQLSPQGAPSVSPPRRPICSRCCAYRARAGAGRCRGDARALSVAGRWVVARWRRAYGGCIAAWGRSFSTPCSRRPLAIKCARSYSRALRDGRCCCVSQRSLPPPWPVSTTAPEYSRLGDTAQVVGRTWGANARDSTLNF